MDPSGLNPFTIYKKLKKFTKNIKLDGSRLDFRGVGSICQIRYKNKPVFRLDYTAYPGTKGEYKLHFHIGNMKKHRPLPDWLNNLYK